MPRSNREDPVHPLGIGEIDLLQRKKKQPSEVLPFRKRIRQLRKRLFRFSHSLRFRLMALCTGFVAAILVLTNTVPVLYMEKMIVDARHTEMIRTATLISNSLSALQTLDSEHIRSVMAILDLTGTNRVIVTDAAGFVVYDNVSATSTRGKTLLLAEIAGALDGYDAFRCHCGSDTIEATAAVPVTYDNQTLGAVFLYELSSEQAAILTGVKFYLRLITIAVGIITLVLLWLISRTIYKRTARLGDAIDIMRKGDYSHRLELSGADEFSMLVDDFNELAGRLQATEEARRRFVSDASHELRTPLSVAKLLSDSIAQSDSMTQEDVREFAQDISAEIERLTRISDHLLQLTRLDAAQKKPLTYVNLSDVVRHAGRMLRPLAETRKIRLHLDLSGDCIVEADEDGLYQVVFNLMENAIKYNCDRGEVHVITFLRDSFVTCIVDDTGVGIPEEDLGRIFDRFYRVDKARSREPGGTGLGLSIVKQTVALYGGTIHAENRPERGTRFVVRIPNRKEAE